jgi:uncharacterized protein
MVQIPINRERLAAFCQKHEIQRLSFFGSVLRDDFRPDSDVDVLVEFLPEAKHSLFDLVRMEMELKNILGRKVDLISRRGVEASRNHLRKQAILDSAEVVYGP